MQTDCVELTGLCMTLTYSGLVVFICSGGNKRKLSTAIALVGSPIIVFLVRYLVIIYKLTPKILLG